ncbi:VOC family protein [Actinomadura sediminis]|uniref:VOC family protein n=1 Tax=Actinomadura sediminis TaxID=1038904 RepID=A0ABW3F138_9ACTN
MLACGNPVRARRFYRERVGTALAHADFTAAASPAQWELALAADDLDGIAARARDHGPEAVPTEHASRSALRLRSPEGLTFLACSATPARHDGGESG